MKDLVQANLIQRDPRQRKLVRIERYRDQDMPKPNLLIRSWMEKSVIMGTLFKVAGVFGVALLLAGKLTDHWFR